MAIPRPLPRPIRRGRTSPGLRERCSTGAARHDRPLASPALHRAAPAKSAPLPSNLVVVRAGYTNLCIAPSSSAAVNGLITYPSAPCCLAQNLSLSVFFELTFTTGLV